MSKQPSQLNRHPKSPISPSRTATQESVQLTRPRTKPLVVDSQVLKFLESDPHLGILERDVRLHGFECFLVEQWACSRARPGHLIITHTGDETKVVLVSVVAIPELEENRGPKTKEYFSTVENFHARPKETRLGTLMITNLSNFPSALTVIPVPEGDLSAKWPSFVVNENLKRLGCVGRSGLTLGTPSNATQAKFLQLYKTNDNINVSTAVVEMVRLCQLALIAFGVLKQGYADGLLCDFTERAVNDWWNKIGVEQFGTDPVDGILGPTTVAALLGTYTGARDRLSIFGAPAPKDPFDMAGMQRAIIYFQKLSGQRVTGELNAPTVEKLHQATEKAMHSERRGFGHAVKSTVADIGGKGGEMVIGLVGGKEKSELGDIETTSLDRFIPLVIGERPKLLWHGRGKRNGTGGLLEGSSIAKFLEEGGYTSKSTHDGTRTPNPAFRRTRGERNRSAELTADVDDDNEKLAQQGPGSWNTDGSLASRDGRTADESAGLHMLRHVASRFTDAKDRVKDAVGRSATRAGHDSSGPSRNLTPTVTRTDSTHLVPPARSSLETNPKSGAVSPLQGPSSPPSRQRSRDPTGERVPLPLSINTAHPHTAALKLSHYTASPASDSVPQLHRRDKDSPTTANLAKHMLGLPSGLSPLPDSLRTSRAGSRMASEGHRPLAGGEGARDEGVRDEGAALAPPIRFRDPAVVRLLKTEGAARPGGEAGHNVLIRTQSSNTPLTHHPASVAQSGGQAMSAVEPETKTEFPAAERAGEELVGKGLKRHASAEDLARSSMLGSSPNALVEMENFGEMHLAVEKDRKELSALRYGLAEPLTSKLALLTSLTSDAPPTAEAQLGTLSSTLAALSRSYEARNESYESLREGSHRLLTQEREMLTEGIRAMEVIVARLEYEFEALEGKAGDLEEALRGFERGVAEVERRCGEVVGGGEAKEVGQKRKGWAEWLWGY